MNSARIFQAPDQRWYIRVRGEQPLGPYPSRQDAQARLDRHVAACRRRTEAPLPRWMNPRAWRREAQRETRVPRAS